MKKTFVLLLLLWGIPQLALACADYEYLSEDPCFIADGLLASVHRDTCYYRGLSQSRYWEMEGEDRKAEMASLEEALAGAQTSPELAHYLEVFCDPNPWGTFQAPEDKQYEMCVDYAANTTNVLEKRRWALQAIKAAHVLKRYDDIIKVYEKYFSDDKMDLIRYRAMGRYALALAKQGKKTEGMNAYLLLYDSYIPYRRIVADSVQARQKGSSLFTDEDIKAFYDSAVNTHKKATLAFIMNDIDRLTGYEPDSPRTLAAVVRQSMLDEKAYLVNNWKVLLGQEKRKSKGYAIYPAVDKGKQGAKPLWLALYGHLKSIHGDTAGADEYFKKCDAAGPDEMLKKQLHMFRTLNEMVKRPGVMDAVLQKMALEDLEWLDTLKGSVYNDSLRRSYFGLLSNRFFAAGDVVRSAAVLRAVGSGYGNFLVDIYAKPEEISGLEDFACGRNAQPLDSYLRPRSGFDQGVTDLLQALKYLRKKDFKKAYEMSLKGNGFGNWYENTITTDGAMLPRPKKQVTRRELIKMIYELSMPDKDPEKQAKRYYSLASIYYFNPYLSYADVIWHETMNLWITGVGPGVGLPSSMTMSEREKAAKTEFFAKDYNNRAYAEQLLKKAMRLTKDRELKAQCAMLLILKKNREQDSSGSYMETYTDKEYFDRLDGNIREDINIKADTYMKMMEGFRSEYGGTEFYKKYVNNCAMFSRMLAAGKPQ